MPRLLIALFDLGRRAVGFVAHHGRLAGGALALFVGAILSRTTRPSAARRAEIERDAEEVRERVASIAVEHGAAAAHAVVQATYSAEMNRMKEKAQAEAVELSRRPEALAAFIVQATGTRKKPV